jgi:hypothetical protein
MTAPQVVPPRVPRRDDALRRDTHDWRSVAVAVVHRAFGTPDDRLVRIVDHRALGPNEAWVAVVVAGRHVTVGLRHVGGAVDDAVESRPDDGFAVLYLCETEGADRSAGPVMW